MSSDPSVNRDTGAQAEAGSAAETRQVVRAATVVALPGQVGEWSDLELAGALRIDQRQRWARGERVRVEAYLEQVPLLADRPGAVVDLLLSERVLAQEAGESPDLEDYLRRFPQHQALLQRQLALQQTVGLASPVRMAAKAKPGVETVDEIPESISPLDFSRPSVWSASLAAATDSGTAAAAAGPRIPGYEILGELGQGGMGVVYKARQVKLKRLVALKMILVREHAASVAIERFRIEAETLARLQHPNIVPIYEIGEVQGTPFFSLEFAEGGSLAERLKKGPLPAEEAARLMETLARAMHAAHQKGIVHRDLKPGNVLLAADGTPKITDFGLAKQLDAADAPLLTADRPIGTPSYMPPEQAEGKMKEVGRLADVYSLGAILYELLTGRPPFRAATIAQTLRQVIEDEPASPRRLNPETPCDLETISLKCLSKEPRRRYASALDLAEDLCRFQAREPVAARPVGRVERTWRWCRRNPVVASLLTLVALVLVTGASISTLFGVRATDQARLAQDKAEEAEESATRARAAEAGQKKKTEDEEKQRKQAQAEKDRAERLLYVDRLSLAQGYWQEGKVAAAREKLDEARDHRDTWEHRYLYTLMNHRGQRTFLGHTGPVTSVCFSPDGKRLASASRDGTAKVWDAASGQELLTLKGHTGCVTSVCFSPDGRCLASASGDLSHPGKAGEVKVWEVATGQELLTLKGHTLDVTSVCFSPDGRRLASGSVDETVKVWDAHTGQEALSLQGHTGIVFSVCFSPDGQRIVSGSGDKTVKVWDVQTGQQALSLKGNTGWVSSVCFSPDGLRIVSGSWDDTVKVWEAQTGQQALSLQGHTGRVSSVAFSPDGKRIVSGSEDRTVRVWDAQTGQEALSLQGHTREIRSVCFSPDGKRIASGSWDQTVKLWEAQTGQQALSLQGHTGGVNSVAFSPDGKRIVSGSGDKTVKVWDAHTGQELLTLKGHTDSVRSVAFSPDGKRIVSGSWDKTVKVWNAHTGQEAFSLQGHTDSVSSVCFSPDSKRIASGGGEANIPGKVTKLGEVKVWDADTGQQQLSLKGHTDPATSVCFSPDGQRIASAGGWDRTVRVWEAQTGQQVLSLQGHTDNVERVCFSPDGQRLASGSRDETVKVWDAHTGQEVLTLKGHTGWVTSVCFSPDGKRLASGSFDKMVKVWDAQTGQQVLSLKGHTGAVYSVCFSPDGNRLAFGSQGWDHKTSRDTDALKVWEAQAEACHWVDPDYRWHAEQARQSWQAADWFAAAFHLNRQLPERPWDADLRVRRAYARSRLGRSAEAATDYLCAVLLDPRVRPWPLDPDAAHRGQRAAHDHDWQQAVADLELAAHQPGATVAAWRNLLLARRAADPKEARPSYQEILNRFESKADATGLLLYSCQEGPCAEADARRLIKVADSLIAGRRDASTLTRLGAALYRGGRFEEAARTLQDSIKGHGKGGYVDSWLFLAMTQQRLGRGAEARKSLAHFERWLKGQKFATWQEKTRWRLLHEEARSLLFAMPRAAE